LYHNDTKRRRTAERPQDFFEGSAVNKSLCCKELTQQPQNRRRKEEKLFIIKILFNNNIKNFFTEKFCGSAEKKKYKIFYEKD